MKDKFQLIITDPPYGVTKANWDHDFPSKEIWLTLSKLLDTNGNFLIFPGEVKLDEKLRILSNIFSYQWVIPWYKPNAMQFGKTGYCKHSLIFWFGNGNIIEKIIDVIVYPICPEKENNGHPSPKPLNVIMKLAKAFSLKKPSFFVTIYVADVGVLLEGFAGAS